jgi:hypothetical protein
MDQDIGRLPHITPARCLISISAVQDGAAVGVSIWLRAVAASVEQTPDRMIPASHSRPSTTPRSGWAPNIAEAAGIGLIGEACAKP